MPRLPAIALVVATLHVPMTAAFAQEPASPLPASVTFAISTGYWEKHADDDTASEAAAGAKTGAPVRRGYYKLFSLRQPDGTAQLHLQRIEAAADGPTIVSSTEIEAFSAMKAYVTDIRPESSDGVKGQPGMFATVHLKTDPAAGASTAWTVLIDDLGDMTVEKASN